MTNIKPDQQLALEGVPPEEALAAVVHELRMPVVFILGVIQFARRDTALASAETDFVAIEAELGNIDAQLSQLLDLRSRVANEQVGSTPITRDVVMSVMKIGDALEAVAAQVNDRAKWLLQGHTVEGAEGLQRLLDQVPVRSAELVRQIRQLVQTDLVQHLKRPV